jgi:hypothetical protein
MVLLVKLFFAASLNYMPFTDLARSLCIENLFTSPTLKITPTSYISSARTQIWYSPHHEADDLPWVCKAQALLLLYKILLWLSHGEIV